MPYSNPRRTRLLFVLLSLVYFISSIFIIDVANRMYVEYYDNDIRTTIYQKLALARAKIEAEIFKDTYSAESLVTLISLQPSFVLGNWPVLAKKIINKTHHVISIGVAPGNVIARVYPLAGNEDAIGLDYRDAPEQLKSVQRAQQLQHVFLAGPMNIVQGGKAFIARFPIFTDYPLNKHYWGCLSIVMDYASILNDAGLPDEKGLTVAIRGKDGEGAKGEVFYGEQSTFISPKFLMPISLPSGQWLLAADYNLNSYGGAAYWEHLISLLGGAISLTFYAYLVFLVRAFRRAKVASMQDDMTHLPNRRYIMKKLKEMIAPASKKHFTLLNIDLDSFKKVNDCFGHEAGDELLIYVGRMLLKNVRASDIVARIGGDEFLIILHRISDKQNVTEIITKIKNDIEGQDFVWRENHFKPSLSIGYAIYFGQDISIKEFLAIADEKMYEDKGINRGG